MKRRFTFALGAILLASAAWTPTASAASEAEKLTAIQNGLLHLCVIQAANGSWSVSSTYTDAGTGAAVFAFLSQQTKWPSPASCTNAATSSVVTFQTVVANGIAFLLGDAVTEPGLHLNPAGQNICGEGGSSCTGIYWSGQGRSTYSTGLVTPAIVTYGLGLGANATATTTGPLAGLTWKQIAQGITDAFAAGQATSLNGNYDGGWHYSVPSNTDADGSTTQWGVIAIGYDESLGAITPPSVKANLPTWLSHVQYTASGLTQGGYSSTGAACYDLSNSYCDHSETGGWEVAMQYVGSNLNAAQLNGISFLNTAWTEGPSGFFGLFGQPYAMWAVYKGLESTVGLHDTTHITNLNTNCGAGVDPPGSGVCNWWEDMNHYLVQHQNNPGVAGAGPVGSGPGGWPDLGGDWPDPLSTALFVNILGATPLPGTITQPPSTVPTLSVWGLVALGILLAGFAAMRLRKAHSR